MRQRARRALRSRQQVDHGWEVSSRLLGKASAVQLPTPLPWLKRDSATLVRLGHDSSWDGVKNVTANPGQLHRQRVRLVALSECLPVAI